MLPTWVGVVSAISLVIIALAEVMQDELEETALDAAATMRNVRRGLSVWRWSRKLLKGKKRP